MKLHIGGLTFTVATNPGIPPESFAIVTETQVAVWHAGNIVMLSREEYDRRPQQYGKGVST